MASLELAGSRSERRRGLLGRDGIDGAILLKPARLVHTIGMRFPIDVAHLDSEMRVIHTTTMDRQRIGRHIRGSRSILEAESGSFERWGLKVGDELTVRE
ncbi:MAG: hypothetical protein MAG471_00313 [Acidimicrobiaceae bacterium]|jgi:hypothetical protein|nr:hypothetical protein [Acidimicrobiaceae bacterium]|tara:strand:+ start:1601 stop:1900 length:300 start_codon:yes stop_codon:yes gene_type:complete